MHVIVLSCTHLQKTIVCFLYLVLTFDPTGKGSIVPKKVLGLKRLHDDASEDCLEQIRTADLSVYITDY